MTDEATVFKTVRGIVARKAELEEEKISLEADFRNDLQISSIVIISIVLAVEETFEIEIADEEIINLTTVGDAVRFIERRLKEPTL